MAIKQLPTLPVTAGASMPAAVNEGNGMYYNEDYYDFDSKSSLPSLYQDLWVVISNALKLGAKIEQYYAPAMLVGSALANQIDKEHALVYADERGDPSKLSARKLRQEFDTRFNAGLDFHIDRLNNGGLRFNLKIETLVTTATPNLSTLIQKAAVYPTSVHLIPQLLDNLARIGYDLNAKVNELELPLNMLMQLKDSLPIDPEDGPQGLARMSNWGFKFRFVNDMAGRPYETLDYDTYHRVTYQSIDNIPSEKNRYRALFEHVFRNTETQMFFHFDLTPEEACYLTQSDVDNVNLIDAAEFFTQCLQSGLVRGTSYASFVTPLPVFANQQRNANGGVEPTNPPRTGHLGLMIAPSTLGLVRVPEQDAVTEYRQEAEEVHVANGRYEFRPQIAGPEGIPIINTTSERVVKVDWVANMMVLSTGGHVDYVDISEWGPATPWHIRRLCEDHTLSKSLDNSPANTTFTRAVTLATRLGLTSSDAVQNSLALSYVPGYRRSMYAKDFTSKGLYPTISKIIEQYLGLRRNENSNLPFAEEFSDRETNSEPIMRRMFTFRGVNAGNPVPVFSLLAEIVGQAYDASVGMTDAEVAKAMGLGIRTVLNWRANMEVWNTYCRGGAQAYQALMEEDASARAAYGPQPEDQDQVPKDFVPKALPNLRPDLKYMPHQAKGRFSLEKNPKFAILAVDAGGGKTISIITDILGRLQDGVVRRPAVYCPSHLLSNYVEDANYATGGQVNIVPICTSTVDNFGREYFERLAKNGPTNTIFVVDYDFCKWNPQWVSYGSIMEEWYGNAQWVRSLGFDGVWFDEAHYLKNDSQRSTAVKQSIVEVIYRVHATGTMLATRLEDVVNQMAILDPGVFGTQDRFNDYHGKDGSFSAKVYDFELGTEISLKLWMSRVMEANCCVIKGRRKEWAALLPPKTVKFHWVTLTEAQRKVYEAILAATVEEIKQDPKLMDLINQQDEDLADQLEAMLQQYLQRIERFLTAPGADELSVALSAADLKSPKGKLIGEMARQHFAKKIPGKILVFTSYIESAKAVYEALPDDVRKHAILYTAARKMECREQFAKDPNVWMMIGVEQSMNTGVNAQFASRLIRVESVYSPGILEQGESRINRPNIKSEEFRTGLYLDWVLVDRSIDVTKSGRLMWRSLDAAKFYNPDSAAYQELPDLNPLRLTIDSITNNNSFNEVLPDYLEGYLELENGVKAGEIAEYKARHPTLDFVPQEVSGVLEGSGVLKQIPYVPGGNLFDEAELGLIPTTEFERLYGKEELKGQYVHTDMGDGEIRRVNKDTLGLVINGEKYTVRKSASFVITKKTTSGSEIRRALAKNVGLKLVDVDLIKQAPVTGPAEPNRAPAPAPVEDAVDPASVPTAGKLLLQIKDTKAADPEWADVVRLKDGRDRMGEAESEEFYIDYMSSRVNRYAQAESLEMDDLAARLIDSSGTVVYFAPAASATPTEEVYEPEPEQQDELPEGDTHGEESPVPEAVDDGAINLLPCFYNEFFAVIVNKNDQDLDELGVDLTDYGFVEARKCGFMALERWQHARDLGKAFAAADLQVPATFYEQLEQVQEALRTNRTHFQQYRHLSQSVSDLRMYQLERRRKLSGKQVRPFFVVCDGTVYVMIDVAQTPIWPQVKSQVRVRGSHWDVDDDSYLLLSETKAKVVQAVRALSKDYPIAESEWVHDVISSMSTAARKAELK
jgi:hypothetical protein